jgi:fimbrial isopeptide formation D2 family protein/LPXTG-motif cell wall-anchored protein
MKKKLMTVLLIAVMVLASFSAVFAAETDGSITVANAAKGETYGLVKLFDATVGANGETAYTGDIPADLADYFTKDTAGNIHKAEGKTDVEIAEAVAAWAKTQTPITTKVGDGNPVVFDGLAYGYYAVTSSQGKGVVTVDSANKQATVYDKNKEDITATKTTDKDSYSIGDTITYTATFNTANYMGEGENAKQVVKYEISDTLPEFLSNAVVDSVTIDGVALDPTPSFSNKKFEIEWATKKADGSYESKYANGADIVVVYKAVLTSTVNINTANTNTISIRPYVDNGGDNPEPWEEEWKAEEVIKTYAAALKKTDGTKPLAGATFTIKGLVVTGEAGEYTVVSYDPNGAESEALATDANGKLYIVGLAEDVTLTVTEYKAPDGYNKLTEPVEVTPQLLSTKIYKESGTIKYDEKGNVIASDATAATTETIEKNLSDLDENAVEVINNAGVEMPSTGGIGTTILYTLGGLLVVGAGVLLVARRKMDN